MGICSKYVNTFGTKGLMNDISNRLLSVIISRKLIVAWFIVLLGACSNVPNEPAYQPSNSVLPTGHKTFVEYANKTRHWLARNRAFVTSNIEAELAANAPYELFPEVKPIKTRGILLVHGLSDSPYSFVDISPELAKMGFHVRTLLLEGHGSRPADLLNADHEHWSRSVHEQITIFKKEVDQLYLGGFSTGANLVASYALQDDDISGLLLFSPGFKAKSDVAMLAPMLPVFKSWLYTPSMKSVTNYVRYMTTPSNGFAQFYHTSAELLDLLEERQYSKPVFMVVSEADSVLDVRHIVELFSSRFNHPSSRLIWFGNNLHSQDSRIQSLPAQVPQMRVSNFSHMGVLFDANNPYYGIKGTQRICGNGQTDWAWRNCISGEDVWYSAWGYQEEAKAHARLTFNPWFDDMIEVIRSVVQAQSALR
jgi:esterase/lipase